MINPVVPLPETVAVSSTQLTVFGAADWTGDDAYLGRDRTIQLTNNDAELLYARTVDPADPVEMDATNYEKVLYEGDTKVLFLKAGQSLNVLRASGSGNATARLFPS